MEGRSESIDLLLASARELADALKAGSIPREDRPRSRKLLFEAWRLAEDASGASVDPSRLIGEIDGVLAGLAARGATPGAGFTTMVREPPEKPATTAFRERGWSDRIRAIEKNVGAMLRRTENMVKNAADGKMKPPVEPAPSAKGSPRGDLELITADSEE